MADPQSRTEILGNALRFAEQQHRVISQNIANVNTPEYKAGELSFDDFLDAAQNRNHDSLSQRGIEVRMKEGLVTRSDGNNVDLDREVAQLKKNAMLFRTFSQLLMSHLTLMRKAMTG